MVIFVKLKVKVVMWFRMKVKVDQGNLCQVESESGSVVQNDYYLLLFLTIPIFLPG